MSAAAPAPETPAPAPRKRRRWGLITLVTLLLLIGVVAGGVYWIVSTPGGAQLVLARVAGALGKGARIEGVEGELGGVLRIKLIVVDQPDLYVRIEDVEIHSSPLEPLRGRLLVQRLYVRDVEVRTASAKSAAKVPVSFKPPYAVRVEDGRIGTLRLGKLPRGAGEDTVLKDIVVSGEGDKSRWRIARAGVTTQYGTARIAGTIGTTTPFPVELDGEFEGTLREQPLRVAAKLGGTLTELQAKLQGRIAGAQASALAVLEPFAAAPVKSLALDAHDVDLAVLAPALPRTRLAIDARLAPQGKDAFAGPVRVTNAEPGRWDLQRLPFQSAQARVVVSTQRVEATDLDIALAGGGAASGRATFKDGALDADLNVRNLDLAALHGGLQKTQATGRITIAAERGAQRFDVALKDPRFEIEGRAALANERLDVETARIVTGGGAIVAKGGMALTGRKEFRFEGRGEHFDPSAFVKTAKGDLNFAFVASGTLAEGLAGEAKIDIAPSTLAGQPAAGRVNIAGDRSRISAADVAVTVGEARLDAKGSFGRAGDALDLVLRIPDLSVVAKPFGLQLAGSAEGDARLTGTFQAPAGRVNLKGANLALPSNVYVRELTLRGEAGTEPSSPVDATLQAKGIAVGKENPPRPVAQSVNATLKGTRVAHRLDVDAVLTRNSTLRAGLQGGLDGRARELTWSGRVESFALAGQGAFALTAPATLSASASRVELGDALLKSEFGEAHLAVTRWTPRTLDLKGTSTGLQVQNLARSLRLGRVPRSSLVLAGDWDIRAAETFEGSLNLRRVSGDLRIGDPPLPLGLKDLVLRVDATRGRAKGSLDINGDRIGRVHGEGSALIVRGDTGWRFAEAAPVEARLDADIPDLQPLAAWIGPEARLGGSLNANVVVSGTGADPSVSGQARAQNLVVREPQSGFEISEGEVALRMTGHSIAIERFVARTPWRPSDRARARMRGVDMVSEGSITAEGSVDLAARQGAIRVKADKVPVTQLPTRFAAISGEARIEAGDKGVVATGAFKADAAWIGALAEALPTVSEDVVVIRASQPASQDEPQAREPMRIDVQLGLNNRVWFQGRGLDTRLDGELRVTGEVGGGPLRAFGRIRTSGGDYEGYGQKLDIERGVLTFNGPLDNPQIDVLALRRGLPVEAGVEIAGTTTRPRVRLVSRPDVPEPEKLSWLVLGRGASDASPGDMSVMLAAARALLGQNNPGSDLTTKLGLDEIHIGRADANSVLGVLPQSTVAGRTGSPAAAEIVSVGKRLNRNLQLNYEQGLADAEGTLKLTWRVTRQFQVLVRAGFLPGVDAVYRWTFK